MKGSIIICIDFETHSYADIKKTGAWVYSEHETTGIFCMAYQTLDMPEPLLWVPGAAVPKVLEDKKAHYVARYALFEYAMIHNVAIPKYYFPIQMLDPERWSCTRAMSLVVGMPGSLGACARALNVDAQKLSTGNALINKYSKPAKDRKTKELYMRPLEGEDREAMYEYCLQDVKADLQCYKKLKSLPNVELERAIFEMDFRQNINGLPVDVKSLKKVLKVLDKAQEKAEKEMEDIGVNVRSVPQMKTHFAEKGCPIPNVQVGTVTKLLGKSDLDPELKKLLELRLFLGKASVKKFNALLDRTANDGFIRYTLNYYGAHTGRWSGAGFQPHNLPRTKTSVKKIADNINSISVSDPPMVIIQKSKEILPGLIKAEKGMSFLMGDYAAIESRGIAYLSGEEKLLKQYRNGEPVYEIMASILYDMPVEAIGKESIERQLGKQVILACGYGMGHKTFKTTCDNYNIKVDTKFAEHAVQTYRSTYPKIKEFWYALERAFASAYTTPGKVFSVGPYIKVMGKNKYVMIQLPSGRSLYYHKVMRGSDGLTYWNFQRDYRVHLYGGILAENVTQALCRDILVHGILECNEASLNPLLHVHDENICYIEDSEKAANRKKFDKIMNTAPEWLPGFPLETESEVCKRYHK